VADKARQFTRQSGVSLERRGAHLYTRPNKVSNVFMFPVRPSNYWGSSNYRGP